jgi:hypothetical protein
MLKSRLSSLALELKTHAPFTLFGAATGVICMLIFRHVPAEANHRLFQVFHPAHVLLSAVVTASLFKLYEKKSHFVYVLIVGYLGAVGVATLSDCILPFFGESILGVALPIHSEVHEHADEHGDDITSGVQTDDPSHGSLRERIHLGFIEDWYVVNPAAIAGILIAWWWPRTKFPHAGHVLISTWASSFHVLMNTHQELSAVMLIGVFVVLFIAVWLPCCVSDIVFPLIFVKSAPLCAHGHCRAEAET